MRYQKPCIFCGRYGNKSKEHFYPDWLSDFFATGGIHNTATLMTQRGDAPKELAAESRRQGHLITKKFRVVCVSCNNEWMSQIESAVKPILVAGINGTEFSLDREQQHNLATWVCLKAMVCEHSDPGLESTPFVDRQVFYTERLIPGYFRIYIGAHSTSSETWLYRHSATISFSKRPSPPLLDGLQRNVQTVTFILGRLVFHVLAARVDEFRLDEDLAYPGLTRLWPVSSNEINIRGLRFLNTSQLSQVTASFEAYLAHQRTTFVEAAI
ncbi:hypothetical protein ACW7G0_13950 [Lysobacter sp. A286]